MLTKAETVGALFEIVVYFTLGREATGPWKPGGEGIGIEMGWRIASGAGIGVLPPNASNVLCLFQYDKIINLFAFDVVSKAYAAETCAHDHSIEKFVGHALVTA